MKENLSQNFSAALEPSNRLEEAAVSDVLALAREGKTQALILKLGGAYDVEDLAKANGAKQFTAKDMFGMENTTENAWRVISYVGGLKVAAREITALATRDTQPDGPSAPKP